MHLCSNLNGVLALAPRLCPPLVFPASVSASSSRRLARGRQLTSLRVVVISCMNNRVGCMSRTRFRPGRGVLALACLVGVSVCFVASAVNDSASADKLTYALPRDTDEAQTAAEGDFLGGLDSVSLNSLLAWSIGALRYAGALSNTIPRDLRTQIQFVLR